MSGFLEELKRRRVVRVALVYGAVTFAVFQFADLVFPRIGLPDRAVTLVVILGLIGFPVALVIGWAFDVTPQGLRRTDSAGSDGVDASALPWLSARTVGATLMLLAAAVVAGWLAGRGGASRTASAEVVSSIAVLPFANLSGNEEDEYFSDGLAEEILNLVARIEGLQVAARTSAFAFKGRDIDVRAIGDSLGVSTVLQGSVRRDGGRVRVTAQLSDASNGYSMWSDRFDAELFPRAGSARPDRAVGGRFDRFHRRRSGRDGAAAAEAPAS
jgi:TolB-like protein